MSSRQLLFGSLGVLLLALTGCPDLDKDAPDAIPPFAVFDPLAGIVPSPTNMAMCVCTDAGCFDSIGGTCDEGHVAFPLDAAAYPEATYGALHGFVTGYMNTLDGFSTTSEAMSLFDTDTIDPATVTSDTVRVYDVTALVAAMGDGIDDYAADDLVVPVDDITIGLKDWVHPATGAPIDALSILPTALYTPGHTYAVVLLSGIATEGGEEVGSTLYFDLLKATEPLIDDAGITKVLQGKMTNDEAALLEVTRAVNDQILQVFEAHAEADGDAAIARKDVVLMWTWSAVSSTEAIMDPVSGVVPTPNDILVCACAEGSDCVDTSGQPCEAGTLALPIAPDASPAEVAFFEWMNTLSGYSILSVPELSGTRPYDLTTVTPQSVILWDITDPAAATPVAYEAAVSGQRLLLTPSSLLEHGHTYLVAITDACKTVDAEGTQYDLVPTPVTALTRLTEPLVDDEGTSLLPGIIDDATAAQLEPLRASMQPVFELLEAADVARSSVASAWTFSTMAAHESIVDPLAPIIPLPNDLLLQGGHLTFPLSDEDPAAQTAFFEYMNSLDGWPALMIPEALFSGPVDQASAEEHIQVFTVADGTATPLEGATITTDDEGGLVVALPVPLSPATTYAIVMTEGATDADGVPLVAASFTRLLVSADPVWEAGESLVSALDKGTAITLELARALQAPVVAAVVDAGVARDDVVLFWSFTVQSGNEALFDPTQGIIPMPNDVVLALDADATPTGLALPAPGDGGALDALFTEMNARLDGFSTLTPLRTSFLRPLAQESLVPLGDLFALLNGVPEGGYSLAVVDFTALDLEALAAGTLDPLALMDLIVLTENDLDFQSQDGGIVMTPKTGAPLAQGSHYMVALFANMESEESDADGEPYPLTASPVFWMARTEHPLVDADGASQIPANLDDASAAMLEQLRANYAPIFDFLAVEADDFAMGLPKKAITRDQVVMFWTFWTQSITGLLEGLRDAVADGDLNEVFWSQATAIAREPMEVEYFQGASEGEHIDKVLVNGTIPGYSLLGESDFSTTPPTLGHFPSSWEGDVPFEVVDIPFTVTIPVEAGANLRPFPIVIVQHGLGGDKEDAYLVADELAAQGVAMIAIDLPYHGAKVGVAGGAPLPNGTGFVTADLFATRDNFTQAALDLHMTVHFIQDELNDLIGEEAPEIGDIAIDTAHIGYMGASLGAMVGMEFIATSKIVDVAAFIAPGGHFARFLEITEDAGYQKLVSDTVAALGISEGTAEYVQFMETLQWVLDAADPVNFAPYLVDEQLDGITPTKSVLYQIPGQDTLFPAAITDELLTATCSSGTCYSLEEYPESCHSFFLSSCGDGETAAVEAERAQAHADAISFIKTQLATY